MLCLTDVLCLTTAMRGLTFEIELFTSLHSYSQKAPAIPAISARFSFFGAKP